MNFVFSEDSKIFEQIHAKLSEITYIHMKPMKNIHNFIKRYGDTLTAVLRVHDNLQELSPDFGSGVCRPVVHP